MIQLLGIMDAMQLTHHHHQCAVPRRADVLAETCLRNVNKAPLGLEDRRLDMQHTQ